MRKRKIPGRTTTPTSLRERVLSHFAALGVPLTSEAFDAALLRAEKEALSYLDLLDRILGEQAARRRERAVERRIREAQFAERKALEAFDWKFNQKAINRQQIEQLATGEFIQRHSNVILIGQSGVGKSHIIQAIGLRACALGYRVLYRTSAQLISDLTASLADKTLPERLRFYNRPDLLLIDEFGFDRIERLECPQAAHLLYKVIDSRHGTSSTAIVSNVDVDLWGDYLADGPLAMAFFDRLVEQAVTIRIKGLSYRAHRKRNGQSEPGNTDAPQNT
jgi:DNA replication protein DnaC